MNDNRKYNSIRREQAKQKTRNDILEAAVRLHSQGNISIQILAEEAGVSVPTIRKHFPTMEDLFQGCSAHFDEQHEPPSPDEWAGIEEMNQKIAVCLKQLFDYYESATGVIWLAYRLKDDYQTMGDNVQGIEQYVDAVAESLLKETLMENADLRGVFRSVLHPLFYRALRAQGGLAAISCIRVARSILEEEWETYQEGSGPNSAN